MGISVILDCRSGRDRFWILILEESAAWRVVWKQKREKQISGKKLGGFGKVYKRDDEDLNWGSDTVDRKDIFERYLKG